MKRYLFVLLIAVSSACSGTLPATAPSGVSMVDGTVMAANKPDSGRRTTSPTKFRLDVSPTDVCDGLSYSGPFYPVSVTGNVVELMWQETPCASRGYQVVIERRDVTNVYAVAVDTVVPEHYASIFLQNGGSYRARVRALGVFDSVGPYTDPDVYFSIDKPENVGQAPVTPPGDDNPPPPPPPGGGDDDNPPPPPPGGGGDDDGGITHGPPTEVTICHVEFHKGHGGAHPVPDSYTSQTLTLPSPAAAAHLLNHALDSINACEE